MACCIGWASSSCSAPYQLSPTTQTRTVGASGDKRGPCRVGGADEAGVPGFWSWPHSFLLV